MKTISWLKLTGFIFSLLLIMPFASVVNAQMMAEVIRSENMPDYPVGTKIYEKTDIKTGHDQKIAIKTSQGDMLVAGKNANIKLVKPGFFSHFFGKIYYFISRRENNNVSVKTTAATIGIRGTKFIIDSSENNNVKETVSLSEGQLTFDSNDDEKFKLYQQRELTEFEKYMREQKAEFEQFKNQMADEFVAYKASINLDSGFALQFDGKKATRVAMDPLMNSEFEEFERFINDNSL